MAEKIFVAMSGGVDSSVAAAIIQQQGYDVCGVTLRVLDSSDNMVGQANKIARSLGVKHVVLDLSSTFQNKIINPFCDEYIAGRTPNPCVNCNMLIKFGALLDKILELGGCRLATGHYAQIENQAGLYHLLQGTDKKKDQSYFLYQLNQNQLSRIMFPLGGWTKEQTRQYFRDYISGAMPIESQDICFIPGGNYRSIIENRASAVPGNIVNQKGDILGKHRGLASYTIGQRHGLGVFSNTPIYVTGVKRNTNELVVGFSAEKSSRFALDNLHWIGNMFPTSIECLTVRLRSQMPNIPVIKLVVEKSGAIFELAKPVPSVAPGQSAVFYRDDEVLGGGTIELCQEEV